jgi:putative ABC transport system ATP-binding protein
MSADETHRKPILVSDGVRKVYRSGADSVVALHGLDLVVPQGEFVAVMGPSGSGKTTLLNCVSGLDEIDAGRVLVDDLSIHELSDKARTKHRAKEMGFIFQAFNLIPVFTATENVELPLLLAGVREHDARLRARETLTRVGLGHRLERRPMELSGGEQQRVAVARALAGTPRIVWADEPTGNLDSEMAAAVMELLGELHAEGLSIILVTHDPTVAAHADRLITVRDGRLVGDEQLGANSSKRDEKAREPVLR